MALFDDRRFLLSHINHSFITGDDTGICEMVMLDEDVFENQHQRCLHIEGLDEQEKQSENHLEPAAYDLDYESELYEAEQGQSYIDDMASDLDYICHRRRSNTAQRLDRLKKEKINQSRTKTIVWRCNSPNNTTMAETDRLSQDSPTSLAGDDLTSNKSETTTTTTATNIAQNRKSKSPPSKSGLTRLLEKFPSLPKNPFDEFAQYDGGMSETMPVKKIMIFIALNNLNQNAQSEHRPDDQSQKQQQHPNQQQQNNQDTSLSGAVATATVATTDPNTTSPLKPKSNGPLEVVIVSTARVQDLIGLICWQYTNENREPKLDSDINRYCLRIVEDNGEVDPDFTSLNPKEPLSKFNFPSLALTEKSQEKLRSYTDQYTNGTNIYAHRLPTIAQNVISSGHKMSNASSRFAALTRIIFKDAKLDNSQ